MPTPTYELIQTYTVATAGNISTISFNSFSGYKDLKLKTSFRHDGAGANGEINLTLNSITSYNRQFVTGQATTSHIAGVTDSGGDLLINYSPYSGATAGSFSQYDMYISDYSNSSYRKQLSSDGGLGYPNSGGQFVVIYAGSPESGTAAITSITFTAPTGYFVIGSLVSLYGIKNS
jgi:hypothetical protein